MNFYNEHGPLAKDQLIELIDNNLNAYIALKKVGIEHHIFENGNASCVDVKKEFEKLKRIVEDFSNDGEYNNDKIVAFHGWDLEALFGKEISNYTDLNNAINERIQFLRTALIDTKTNTVYVKEPVANSVDKNTMWTCIIAVFAIGAGFLYQLSNNAFQGIMGCFVIVLALTMVCYRNKWFGKIN